MVSYTERRHKAANQCENIFFLSPKEEHGEKTADKDDLGYIHHIPRDGMLFSV
jgi:hypothetical protein